jgi:hypothetical protein
MNLINERQPGPYRTYTQAVDASIVNYIIRGDNTKVVGFNPRTPSNSQITHKTGSAHNSILSPQTP